MLPADTPAWAHGLERRLLGAIGVVWDVRAELLQTAALLGGWVLVTAGVAHLTAPIAWAFSLGLLLLLGCGVKWLSLFFWRGLYALTQDPDA